ncbi:Aste57867_12363 [Aphanomyces stellatus]|uniref:Aste57867_12363 protein n=1 Tax=Aphanomyces stellatus TaxID=120398 RepID=A0A485KXD2_9STRA|nr:hypothetical protein As57867_012317 [Aphanomyces stellatus]VFT89215.1 Aste57867_12363 [Aphanomyces stellatus]
MRGPATHVGWEFEEEGQSVLRTRDRIQTLTMLATSPVPIDSRLPSPPRVLPELEATRTPGWAGKPPALNAKPPRFNFGVRSFGLSPPRGRVVQRPGRERRGNSVDTSVDELNRQLTTEPHEAPIHLFYGPRTTDGGNDKDQSDKPVLHTERKIHKNRTAVWMESEPKEDEVDEHGGAPKFVRRGSFNSRVQAVGKYWGTKVLQAVGQLKEPPLAVHPDSFCDGCGMDPIVGDMFTCSTCANYSLCHTCYKNGIHGFEDSKLLKKVKEDYTVETMFENCKQRVPEEVFTELLHNVCHGQVDKFKFLAKWICGVVNGHTLSELAVRGIEIPHLRPSTRARFVQLLTPPLTERQDMEVSMEWFVPPTEPDSETLRIWVCTDKETKSPFAPKKAGEPASPIVYSPAASTHHHHDMTESSIYSPPLLSPAMTPSMDAAAPPASPSKLSLAPLDIDVSPTGSLKFEMRHQESMDGPCTPRFASADDDVSLEPLEPAPVVVVKPEFDGDAIHTPHAAAAHTSF